MLDYVIVSMHEKGFWQADVYLSRERAPEDGDCPDGFTTFSKGASLDTVMEWTSNHYPVSSVHVLDDDEDCDSEDD